MKLLHVVLAMLMLSAAGDGCGRDDVLRALDERAFPEGTSRLALVVWSENYHRLSPVVNAGNDGARIAQALHRLEFDFVRVIPDADSVDKILDGVEELGAQIAASSRPVLVVFFFAGHGFQVDGQNYLVPALASNDSVLDLVNDSVSLSDISRRLGPARRAGRLLVMVDACRTMRFLDDGSVHDIPLHHDLAPGFSDGNLLAPALVSMAAAPGHAARSASRLEGRKNSPYTTALAPLLTKTGLSLATLLEVTQSRVLQDTDESQRPSWFNGAASSRFFMKPGARERRQDEQAWTIVRQHPANLRGCALDYLLAYPTGRFALHAEYLLSVVDTVGGYCSTH